MDILTSWFSFSAIMGLPWIIKGPGLVIIGLFIYRFVKSVLQFQAASMVAALFWIVFTGVIMTKFGMEFAHMIAKIV